jgi:preprotein translocase subunit SecD
MKILPLTVLFLALMAGVLLASGGKKPPPMAFRIHAESHPRDTEVFAMPLTVGNPPVNVFVERMPLVTENEVKAMFPFASQLGGYGVYFQLDNHGTKVWETITTSRRDGFLAVVFNGRGVSRLRLGRPVQDGIVMVPGGVTEQEIQVMAQRYPFIGESPAKTQQRQRQGQWMP